MAESSGTPKGLLSASVFFCPNGESTKNHTHSTKVRLSATTTFGDLHTATCLYYSQKPTDWVLCNENGAIFPIKKFVVDEMRHGGSIRFRPNEEKFDEVEVKEEEEAEEEEKLEDDGRVVGARAPKTRELVLHFLFLSILVVDTYLGSNTEGRYKVHSALEKAFIHPRGAQYAAAGSGGATTDSFIAQDFRKIHTTSQMCSWLKVRLPDGLFRSDMGDGWGSVAIFNRVAGGVSVTAAYQDWQNVTEQYTSRQPYIPFLAGLTNWRQVVSRVAPERLPLRVNHSAGQGGSAGTASGPPINYTAVLLSDVEALAYGVCGWEPTAQLTPGSAQFDPNAYAELRDATALGEKLTFEQWSAEVSDHKSTEAKPRTRVMRSLRVSLLFYNHNYGLYVSGSFVFDLKMSGRVSPYYAFKPFGLEPPTGSPQHEPSFLPTFPLRVRLWLVAVNTVLVLSRTYNELITAAGIVRKTGSILPYITGVFTQLEVFNLCMNYVGLAFRFVSMFMPNRVNLEAMIQQGVESGYDIETFGDSIALVEGCILTARALSIISAMLLLFKYLELAPRRLFPSVNLTGTTIGRAGRDVQVVFYCFMALLAAFSVTGEQLFGSQMQEFSSVPSAFLQLVICVSGSGAIYSKLTSHFPTLGPIYFIVFTMTHLLLITPLFLATLNDAYAVRDEQVRLLAERKAAKEAQRAAEREKRRKEQQQLAI